jgi:hypothetical protein
MNCSEWNLDIANWKIAETYDGNVFYGSLIVLGKNSKLTDNRTEIIKGAVLIELGSVILVSIQKSVLLCGRRCHRMYKEHIKHFLLFRTSKIFVQFQKHEFSVS